MATTRTVKKIKKISNFWSLCPSLPPHKRILYNSIMRRTTRGHRGRSNYSRVAYVRPSEHDNRRGIGFTRAHSTVRRRRRRTRGQSAYNKRLYRKRRPSLYIYIRVHTNNLRIYLLIFFFFQK